ncbi:MAG: response regulator transcription factor [Syntrophobacteraceae bacterium]|jgi:DNA-binding NarL/FixJ family response regulator|nr:response regulator transcription factor [Syntrophobacteraceae bacterium]
MASYRVLIADDHPLFRQGIRSLIEKDSDIEVVGEAGDGFDLLEMIKRVPANLVIMDIAMPRIQGLDATREVKRIFPETAVLILTMHNSKQYLYHAMSAGADGYLLKEDAHDDLVTAIRTIQRGKFYVSPLVADQVTDILVQRSRGEDLARDPLSPREREVLKLVAEGRSSKEIAEILFISTMTVQNHRANIKRKLKLHRNSDLIKYAMDKGYA